MHIFTPRLRPYTATVLLYMIGFLAASLATGNREFLFYQGTMLVIISAVVYMDKRAQFSALVLGGLTFWGFMHLAGGLIPVPASWTDPGEMTPVLYDFRPVPFIPKYDQLLHAFGFGMAVITAREALQAHLQRPLPINAPIAAALFFIALGLGALNEMIEFTAVLLIDKTEVGGYVNTGWDLISNATGAALALLYLRKARP